MSKKIIISFFEDESFISESDDYCLLPTFTRAITTDMTLDQIEKLLDIGEGFSIKLVEGDHFSTVDFFSFLGRNDEVIDLIKTIPKSSVCPNVHTFKYLYKRELSDESPISRDRVGIHNRYRYEQGASGFNDIVVQYSNNPWFMLVFGYVFGKACDYILHKIFRKTDQHMINRIIFSAKKFYKHAASAINCEYINLQITDIEPTRSNTYRVNFRNMNGDCFKAVCRPNGKIIKLSTKTQVTASLET